MATMGPEKIVAVDVSPVQLYLMELKIVAIKHLSREEYMGFMGFTGAQHNELTYDELRPHLSAACRPARTWNPECAREWHHAPFSSTGGQSQSCIFLSCAAEVPKVEITENLPR